MNSTLDIGGIPVEVIFKSIKNVHLYVYPPSGAVRISAPRRMNLQIVRAFAATKIGWIRQQQRKFWAQERETPRDWVDRESHYVWGRRCLLKVGQADMAPSVEWHHDRLTLTVRPGADVAKKQEVMAEWYRRQVEEAALPLVAKWQKALGVKVGQLFFRHMKTRWGSCNIRTHNIRLNSELGKKPPQCLEYIVVHELLHLLEPSHNAKFKELLQRHFPAWKQCRDKLNSLPVRHEAWDY